MAYAIMYDPCHNCEHKKLQTMCSMCELTYLRNCSFSKLVEYSKTKCDEYNEVKREELLRHVDDVFSKIMKNLEEDDKESSNEASDGN